MRWFPVGGIGGGFVENLYYLFLPALTLALSLAMVLMRNLRAALIEVLHAEFVQFATAKGLRRRVVLGRHVLRNALDLDGDPARPAHRFAASAAR